MVRKDLLDPAEDQILQGCLQTSIAYLCEGEFLLWINGWRLLLLPQGIAKFCTDEKIQQADN